MLDDRFDINKLINNAFFNSDTGEKFFLRVQYDRRLQELGISSNQVEQNLQIEYRTLNGILDGNLQRFDLLSLLKIGYFLGIPEEEIVQFYTQFVAARHEADLNLAKKRTFILNHFDLPVLRSIKVINSIREFDEIEAQLNEIFGLSSILEYDIAEIGAAYSSTNLIPKNEKSRNYFKNKAKKIFQFIDNPNAFNKEALIRFFPHIRQRSLDLEDGLVTTIQALYNIGVTVVFHPRMPSLQIRGATFAVNGKPCIILTDYRESYPTLWHALLHELFHVLFDWDEIVQQQYHLSDEEDARVLLKHKEDEANEFARDYFFPLQKLEWIRARIDQKIIVQEFAFSNHVHPSIIYSTFAYTYRNDALNYWALYDKLIRPPMTDLVQKLSNGLSHGASAAKFAEFYKSTIFKTTPS